MAWYESKIILVCLPVIIIGIAFLIQVAPPLPEEDQVFLKQLDDYAMAAARSQEEMAASPWNGNLTLLALHGEQEKLLATRYRSIFTGSAGSGALSGAREEVLWAINYEEASADDMIAASGAFGDGGDDTGAMLLQRAADRKRLQFSHLDRARVLTGEAVILNRLQYIPTG